VMDRHCFVKRTFLTSQCRETGMPSQ
jgi:hypothetical protein